MSQHQLETQVDEIVRETLYPDAIEEVFCGLIVKNTEDEYRKNYELELLKKLLDAQTQQETKELVLRYYVHNVFSQFNSRRSKSLLDVLERAVQSSVLSARMVSEALLHCEILCYQNAPVWCQAFKLLYKIIGGVDYKGCRDLLRDILEKAQSIPSDADASEQIKALKQVVELVLDRNACLLPGYFAVNEVTKHSKPWPHWTIGRLLADFVQSFRPTAQMVTGAGRTSLRPVVGYSSTITNTWKLNPNNLRFPVQGPLPYNHELLMPQTELLKYVVRQSYSKDMVISMLCLNKQAKTRCIILEEELVHLIVTVMKCEENSDAASSEANLQLWQHLSAQLIFFVLSQFASFPHIIMALYDKLKDLRKGRDQLMWVLLQFISGSIQKNALSDFLPVMKLHDILYPEKEPHPVPDLSDPNCTRVMAATCIWIHLSKKAESQKMSLSRPIPNPLLSHISFLKQLQTTNVTISEHSYAIALLSNAYSTNPERFSRPLGILVESIYGNNTSVTMLPGNISASAPTQPLPMKLLDSLTVHAKMSLIHQIVQSVMRVAQNKASPALAPAMIETYARLLVYTEIESLGIKGFISQLLPSVFKSSAWGILHTLLDMFSYRLHHIQPHYRVQLLSNLYMLNQVQQTNNLIQLHLCAESTSLRLITSLGSAEVQTQLSRFLSEPKNQSLLSSENEELNRALVLTVARAMAMTGSESISGSWCKDLLTSIMQQTAHSWSTHTLECFPNVLADFFRQNPIQRESKSQLKIQVNQEYQRWQMTVSENDAIAHFSQQGAPPIFLCVLWKCLLDDLQVSPAAYKVLERLGAKALSQHLRTFADYLVFEFCHCQQQFFQRYVDVTADLVWKCNVVPIDKLVLTLVLRHFEGNEAQVCYLIMQRVLLKQEFRNRVNDFVNDNSPEHWLHSNWHEKHMAFHQKYPERFNYEGLQELPGSQGALQSHMYLPVYFSNVCLRFLPVFDLVIHRLIEMQPSHKLLEPLLDNLGKIYRFHNRPLTYLFNTLHYYDRKLKDRPSLKKKLLQTIIGTLGCVKPRDWCLTNDYLEYLQTGPEQINWLPDYSYYKRLVARLVDTINDKPMFTGCEWRFNEFPNAATHALYATCIEVMALPVASYIVGGELVDVVLKWGVQIPRESLLSWMNAVGLLLSALPENYWSAINDRLIKQLTFDPVLTHCPASVDIFSMLDFESCFTTYEEQHSSMLMSLVQALWHHATIGQLSSIPQFIKDKVKPVTKTEEQYIFICHLIGPFLQRLQTERTRCLMELTVVLYELLEQVDMACENFKYMDAISDFLYHLKYKLVGDGVKNEIDKHIRKLRPQLQLRLRFISYQSKDDLQTPASVVSAS